MQKGGNTEMSPEAQVAIGADGWLFLVGGQNDVRSLYQSSSENRDRTKRWADLLAVRVQRLEKQGIRYVHLGAPEKLSIYGERLGFDPSLSPLRCLEDALKEIRAEKHVVNPTTELRNPVAGFDTYWRTDSHWTPWGCFTAYQMLCSRLGVDERGDLLSRPSIKGEILLDLAAKIGRDDKEMACFYRFECDAVRVAANGLVLFKEANNLLNEVGLHVGSRVVFRNHSREAQPSKVILFGDSFSEYRTHLLTGMMAETFRELHFIWSADIDYDYVEKHRPDIVVTELAERFLSRVPDDEFRCDDFAARRLRDYRAG